MKQFIILIFLLVHRFKLYSEEKVIIGISPPYLRNENSATMFYNKQFLFEMLFKSSSDKFTFEIINIIEPDIKIESSYLKNCKRGAINNGYDYLLYSSVYSNDFYLFFKVQLLNPYTDEVIFLKVIVSKFSNMIL